MHRKWFAFFFAILMVFFFIPFESRAATIDVIISEVAWAGSSKSTADEWVELANISDHDVDISNWSLNGAASSSILIPVNTILASHSTYLISNYAHTNTSSTLNTPAQIVTTMVSLPNDKLGITLTAPDRGVVDSAGNGGTPFAGKSGGTGGTTDGIFRSMERRDCLIDGTQKSAWSDADVASGLKTNSTDLGTPGTINSTLLQEIAAQQISLSATTPVPTPDSTTIAPIVSNTDSSVTVTDPVTTPLCDDVVADPVATTAPADTTTQTPTDTNTPLTTSSTTETSTPTSQSSSLEETATLVTSVVSSSAIPNSTIAQTGIQGTLIINEIYPHPATGEAEWIELLNDSGTPVDITNWKILDASNAMTTLPNTIISPGEFFTVENPKGKLNNDGDAVVLENANGVVIDSMEYNTDLGDVPALGESFVRTNKTTFTISTTSTKNTVNILTPRTSSPSTSTSSTTTGTTDVATVTPLATNRTTETSTQPSTLTTQTTQTPPLPIIKTLRLSELYPDTGGKDTTDEFIEIENTGDEPITLTNWKLTDANGAHFTFSNTDTIASHAFLALYRSQTKLTLTNSGDTITLIAPDESIIDTKTYDKTKKLLSFARDNNLWYWTSTISPNEPNTFSTNSSSLSSTNNATTQTSSSTSHTTNASRAIRPRLLTIEEAKNQPLGSRVYVEGIVTVAPDVFNKQTIYIQDKTGGIQIYKNDGHFPTLVEKQFVRINGVLGQTNGEARIKINKSSTIVAGNISNTSVSPASGNQTSIGTLMTIAGTIASHTGNRLNLRVDGESWNVELPKSDTTQYRNGSEIQINGVLTKTKSGTLLKTRSPEDTKNIDDATTTKQAPEQSSNKSIATVLMLIATTAFVGRILQPRIQSFLSRYAEKTPHTPRTQKAS